MGRQAGAPALAAMPGGGFQAAWVSDGRTVGLAQYGQRLRVWTGRIGGDGKETAGPPPELGPADRRAAEAAASKVHAEERGDLARIRAYRAEVGGRRLAIYRGDLHRHCEISVDGVGDGTLDEMYRYALDAASLDFLLVGDHGMGHDREYPWWQTQKSNDLIFKQDFHG